MQIPERIGDYTILGVLGEGAMARVYRARHISGQGPEYALKTILGIDDAETRARFGREIEIGMHLRHPNICLLLDHGVDGTTPFMVMELLSGQLLETYVQARGHLSLEESCRLMRDILSGLQVIHEAGIVHRDLKPTNVFITAEGPVKIMDFGIARRGGAASLTASGSVLGTPKYASPEQILDPKTVDRRSDLFTAGVLFYFMLTGHAPFEAPTLGMMLLKVGQNQVTPLTNFRSDLPPSVTEWLGRLLVRKPENRFQDANEALAALAVLQPC